jgi:hypothetical protein
MILRNGDRAGPGQALRTRAISYSEVQRAADANGLTVEQVLALIGRTDGRYVVDYPVEDARIVAPKPAAAASSPSDGSR